MSEYLGLARRIWALGIMALAVGAKAQEAPLPADPAAVAEARELGPIHGFEARLGKLRVPDRVPGTRRTEPARSVIRLAAYQAAKPATPRPEAVAPAAEMEQAAPPRSGLPILTLDRFDRAMQIARLAAEEDMPGHGVDAVRVALRGGPPVVPANPNELRRVIRPNRVLVDGEIDPVSPKVFSYMVELQRLWHRHHVPDESVYLALREAVLPRGRPTEIFLYASALNVTSLRRPQSVAADLASLAVRAGKVDDLRRTLATRDGQVMAELPAAILSTQLAIAAGDPAGAKKGLQAIAARLKHDSSRISTLLACHAALLALNHPTAELSTSALDVLDECVKGFEIAPSAQGEPLGTLLIMMARRQFQLGDAPGGRKRLNAYLEVMDKITSQYSGDYLVRLLRRMAAIPAKERYETLRAWTMPTQDRRAVRLLTALAARDRVPDVFAQVESSATSPDEPIGAGQGAMQSDLLSTATALIDAARQAGTLDQLAEEARAAAEPVGILKIENAEMLHLLIELARGQGAKVAARIEGRLTALIKENEAHAVATSAPPGAIVRAGKSQENAGTFPWTDYLLARAAAMADEPISRLGLRLTQVLVERAEQVNGWGLIAIMRGELAEAEARRAGAPDVLARPALAAWHPTNMRVGYYLLSTEPASYWIAQQGHVVHPAGSTADLLLFDYPLTGSYEFSVDAYNDTRGHAVAVHNGLGILPSREEERGGNAMVLVAGHTERLLIPWRLSRPRGFNRVTVQATPQKVRFLVNGHLFYEDDDPGPTSPWIGLMTSRERNSTWRNPSLRGAPIVPREVRLSECDRLDGWVPNFYRETLPPRLGPESFDSYGRGPRAGGIASRLPMAGATTKPQTGTPKEPIKLDDYDWAAQDGVIHGRRVRGGTTPRRVVAFDPDGSGMKADQSRLYYQRPLHDGDSIDYEFLYEPGQVMVHPSIDRVAFLLEPDGVKVHWITVGAGDRSGLPADNAAEEPGNRRGPKTVPLKPGEWNAIKLAFNGDKITIELNGQAIYERAMEPTLDRQFGLFHYKDQTAVQARNFVLRGRWPEALTPDILANLLAPDPAAPHSDADRRARHAVIGEPLFALQAGEFVDETGKLSPAERYQRLADWVLPSPDHPVFRLEGDFTPSFSVASSPTSHSTGDHGPVHGARAQTGGMIRAPALELVDTAKSLGKLDELATRVEQIQVPVDDNRTINERGKRALLVLIQIARRDDVAAAKAIEAIKPVLEKIPLDQPEWARWPELALASRAIERAALLRPALAILDTLTEQAGKNSPSELWTQQVTNVRARAELLVAAEKGEGDASRPFGTDPELPFWARVTPTRAETRGEGRPVAHWSAREGRLTHYPGHDQDLMYLAVPLRGEFQLDCELTSAPGREIRVMYGGLAVAPKSDLKHLEQSSFGRPATDLTLDPPLEKLSEWYPFRLVVKGNQATTLINGRKVYEAPVPADGDPWRALVCTALQSGGARKITIDGDPQIPQKLNLSVLPSLDGWLTGEYNESATGADPDWDKRGEEIIGRLIENCPGSKQESVLRYHRPMIEDGRISYEFYYDPDQVMVHPVLDRLTFVLGADGVKIHWLTDGAYERSGLTPENARDEPDNRRGPASIPLKPGAWNRLALSLAGDRVALELNDQAIYERILEPTNQRSFGLFHYADLTQVRVRNVTYQGNWPRSLPASLRPQ